MKTLHRTFVTAALLGAASLTASSGFADDKVPPPPGVTRVPQAAPANGEDTPAAPEALPSLPENPIRPEKPAPGNDVPLDDSMPIGVPAESPRAMEQSAAATHGDQVPVMAQKKKPARPVGPVYYFAPNSNSYPGNLNVLPPLHVPNSPEIHDLSVSGTHQRYPYYSYRRPWYTPGHPSQNVTIVW